jgi:hypothetical protein
MLEGIKESILHSCAMPEYYMTSGTGLNPDARMLMPV